MPNGFESLHLLDQTIWSFFFIEKQTVYFYNEEEDHRQIVGSGGWLFKSKYFFPI